MIDDEPDDRESTAAPDTTRRRLLRAATGGFALATSGLLVPAWLSEHAAADAHPVRRIQHRKDQRRTKHRHKLQHRRKARQRTQRGRNQALPTAILRGIQFTVGVRGIARTVEVYVHPSEFLDTGMKLFDWKIADPGAPITTQTSRGFAALWIDNRYYIAAVNYFPPYAGEEWVGLAGRIDPKDGWVDGGLHFKGDLSPTTRTIDGSAPVLFDTQWVVHFLRRPDDADFKRFEVLIQPNPY
jgi:hypothetical protein